jgi:Domain of unknown function (DUF397)
MDKKHHHRASDLTAPTWRKSSVSGNATQCVEIASYLAVISRSVTLTSSPAIEMGV